ncbi:MAG: hypothetical protein ACOCUU_01460 [Nanoarchaeota archaeon]
MNLTKKLMHSKKYWSSTLSKIFLGMALIASPLQANPPEINSILKLNKKEYKAEWKNAVHMAEDVGKKFGQLSNKINSGNEFDYLGAVFNAHLAKQKPERIIVTRSAESKKQQKNNRTARSYLLQHENLEDITLAETNPFGGKPNPIIKTNNQVLHTLGIQKTIATRYHLLENLHINQFIIQFENTKKLEDFDSSGIWYNCLYKYPRIFSDFQNLIILDYPSEMNSKQSSARYLADDLYCWEKFPDSTPKLSKLEKKIAGLWESENKKTRVLINKKGLAIDLGKNYSGQVFPTGSFRLISTQQGQLWQLPPKTSGQNQIPFEIYNKTNLLIRDLGNNPPINSFKDLKSGKPIKLKKIYSSKDLEIIHQKMPLPILGRWIAKEMQGKPGKKPIIIDSKGRKIKRGKIKLRFEQDKRGNARELTDDEERWDVNYFKYSINTNTNPKVLNLNFKEGIKETKKEFPIKFPNKHELHLDITPDNNQDFDEFVAFSRNLRGFYDPEKQKIKNINTKKNKIKNLEEVKELLSGKWEYSGDSKRIPENLRFFFSKDSFGYFMNEQFVGPFKYEIRGDSNFKEIVIKENERKINFGDFRFNSEDELLLKTLHRDPKTEQESKHFIYLEKISNKSQEKDMGILKKSSQKNTQQQIGTWVYLKGNDRLLDFKVKFNEQEILSRTRKKTFGPYSYVTIPHFIPGSINFHVNSDKEDFTIYSAFKQNNNKEELIFNTRELIRTWKKAHLQRGDWKRDYGKEIRTKRKIKELKGLLKGTWKLDKDTPSPVYWGFDDNHIYTPEKIVQYHCNSNRPTQLINSDNTNDIYNLGLIMTFRDHLKIRNNNKNSFFKKQDNELLEDKLNTKSSK